MLLFRIFSKTLISSAATSISKTAPAILEIRTWPPAIKQKDKHGNLISTIPMTSLEAKRARLTFDSRNGRSIDIYGHAAAALQVNLRHPDIPKSIFEIIKKITQIEGIDINKLNALSAYVSWFPKSDDNGDLVATGRIANQNEQNEFLKTVVEDELREVKKRVLAFFAVEYRAENSNVVDDQRMYGKLDPERINLFEHLNFSAMIRECYRMMEVNVSNNTLIMNKTKQNATYFGLDMLRRHRALLISHDVEREPIAAEHVCTTAAMRLLEAGAGSNMYKEAVEKIIHEKPELAHGLPIVDLTHYVAKEIASRTEPRPTSTSIFKERRTPTS